MCAYVCSMYILYTYTFIYKIHMAKVQVLEKKNYAYFMINYLQNDTAGMKVIMISSELQAASNKNIRNMMR